ncbi:MAG: sigma-70 family RNA polymerase sigma factor [Acidobacteria bacterium]|nr:sigma-70 family RNA polymerase sigma factor [Acidobacteriota bacterium]
MANSRSDVGGEAEWIKRCQAGDGEAFAPLVEAYQRRIFHLVFHLVRRREDVEDIVQDIFMKAFAAISSYNFQSSFGTWLNRIAVNHCYDYLRRRRSSRISYFWEMSEEGQRGIESTARSREPGGLSNEDRLALNDLTSKLLGRAPAEDRVILTLKEIEEKSVEEIAEILGLKSSTVKVRLHRARKRMVKDLKKWQEGR